MSNGGAAFFAGKSINNKEPKEQASIAGAVAMALHVRQMAKFYGIPVVLHSDHCAKKLLPWFDGMLQADEVHMPCPFAPRLPLGFEVLVPFRPLFPRLPRFYLFLCGRVLGKRFVSKGKEGLARENAPLRLTRMFFIIAETYHTYSSWSSSAVVPVTLARVETSMPK